jgi:hypothetical protein
METTLEVDVGGISQRALNARLSVILNASVS